MTKQEDVARRVKDILTNNSGRICHLYMQPSNALVVLCQSIADEILRDEASQGVMLRVKCPDCEWSQFGDGESVGMTPCLRCGSTGYITEPLIREK